MCGLFLNFFRKKSPRTLFTWALVFLVVGSAISLLVSQPIRSAPDEALVELSREFWQPDAAAVAEELETYRGGWLTQMPSRVDDSLFFDFQFGPLEWLRRSLTYGRAQPMMVEPRPVVAG
jgi:uncharacterized membrane protein YeiB